MPAPWSLTPTKSLHSPAAAAADFVVIGVTRSRRAACYLRSRTCPLSRRQTVPCYPGFSTSRTAAARGGGARARGDARRRSPAGGKMFAVNGDAGSPFDCTGAGRGTCAGAGGAATAAAARGTWGARPAPAHGRCAARGDACTRRTRVACRWRPRRATMPRPAARWRRPRRAHRRRPQGGRVDARHLGESPEAARGREARVASVRVRLASLPGARGPAVCVLRRWLVCLLCTKRRMAQTSAHTRYARALFVSGCHVAERPRRLPGDAASRARHTTHAVPIG